LRAIRANLKAFTATLNAKDGLERLGTIIAVDLFNMNQDRFWPDAPQTEQIGGFEFHFRCLRNIGNVFRIDTGDGSSEVGALDFIFRKEGFTDINKPLAECERAGGPWGGRILADKARRLAFAKDVAHDLERALNPLNGGFGLKTKLHSDAANRISAGMVTRARVIWGKLQMKYHPNNWTAGTSERQAILAQVS
jgi:hypothetical protein